jgi:two-component system sensor histidine kinase RegB
MRERQVSIQDITNRKNLLLLVTLRWLAVAGQIAAIITASLLLDIQLPIGPMAGVIGFLIVLNLATLNRYRSGAAVTSIELLVELLLDVAALTVQLYLSGGATNPFVSLFLLQAVLGAVLLSSWSTWTVVAVTAGCFVWLMSSTNDIGLSMPMPAVAYRQNRFFDLHIDGMFICFLLASVLLVLFITRINRNLREQDTRLAALRQQSAEEEHIVRLGLLASGAAHELGTPLATLSVILNDWARMQVLQADPELAGDIEAMQTQLARCKDIVSAILRSSGEARGEGAERASLIAFIDGVVADWEIRRGPPMLDYTNALDRDVEIVADVLLQQILFNVLDNAYEASTDRIVVEVAQEDDLLRIAVHDSGPGFPPEMLAELGTPYRSSKGQPGRGLGLFLVINVLRKLGGGVTASNPSGGGACVELRLPIAALAVESNYAG